MSLKNNIQIINNIELSSSAGVGRTGTYIAIDILTQMADKEKAVDVYHCVKTLCDHRMNMVQTLVSKPLDIQILIN